MNRLAVLLLAALAAGCTGESGGGAKSGRVDVRVQGNGAPLADATIVFHDAKGEVLTAVLTDVNGQAFYSDVPPGGMVTAVFKRAASNPGDPDSFLFRTLGGLDAGDDLLFVFDHPTSDLQLTTLPVSLPVFAGAASYDMRTACSGGGATGPAFPIVISEKCLDGAGLVDFVAFAQDDQDAPIAFAVLDDVDIFGVSEVVMPAWRTDITPAPVHIEDIPSNVESGFSSVSVIDSGRPVELFESGTVFDGDATLEGFSLPDFGDEATRITVIFYEDEETSSIRLERLPLPLVETTFSIDDFLPPLFGVFVVDSSAGASRPVVRWDDVSLSRADLFRADASWEGASSTLLWTMAVSASSVGNAELRFPSLPPNIAGLVPADAPPEIFVQMLGSDDLEFDDLKHFAAGEFDFEPTEHAFSDLLFSQSAFE